MINSKITLQLSEMSVELINSSDYKETLRAIVEFSASILECKRVCLMIKNKRNEIVIKEGIPFDGHGIGRRLMPQYGETFLRRIMEEKSVAVIESPLNDRRVVYMNDLIARYDISAILFAPLFYDGEDAGMLIFDAVNGKKFCQGDMHIAKIISRISAAAIFREYEKRKSREKILQAEKLCLLGENAARMAHIIRNSLTPIGGFANRIEKILRLKEKDWEGDGDFQNLKKYAKIIIEDNKKLEEVVTNVLRFSTRRVCLDYRHNVNEFLIEEVEKLKCINLDLALKLDKRLDKMVVVFDKKMLAVCIQDLVRNAKEASAKRILIRSKLNAAKRKILIIIVDDGKGIDPFLIKDIFIPFVTTKINGSGLGLANVKEIIDSHGGDITAENRRKGTEFKISLPF